MSNKCPKSHILSSIYFLFYLCIYLSSKAWSKWMYCHSWWLERTPVLCSIIAGRMSPRPIHTTWWIRDNIECQVNKAMTEYLMSYGITTVLHSHTRLKIMQVWSWIKGLQHQIFFQENNDKNDDDNRDSLMWTEFVGMVPRKLVTHQ